jgi:hypothetical protein
MWNNLQGYLRWGITGLAVLIGVVLVNLVFNLGSGTGKRGAAEIVYDKPLHAVHSTTSLSTKLQSITGTQPNQPRIFIPVAFYDFGAVPENRTITERFLVFNIGTVPVVISNAYTTCGCTTAEFSSTVIPPGKAIVITISFNPSMHNLVGTTVRRGLIFTSDDPSSPQAEIWIQADIVKSIH